MLLTDIGELIDEALAQIEHSNREKLQDVFRNISFNNESTLGETKERNDRLRKMTLISIFLFIKKMELMMKFIRRGLDTSFTSQFSLDIR